MEPVLGWYPSGYASFTFRDQRRYDPTLKAEVDVGWLISIIPEACNPSLWKNQKGFNALRVPRDQKFLVKGLLLKNGLWYDPRTGYWYRRRRFEKIQRRKEQSQKYRERKRQEHLGETGTKETTTA